MPMKNTRKIRYDLDFDQLTENEEDTILLLNEDFEEIVYCFDSKGTTILHAVSYKNNLRLLNEIYSHSIRPEFVRLEGSGSTPLHFSIW